MLTRLVGAASNADAVCDVSTSAAAMDDPDFLEDLRIARRAEGGFSRFWAWRCWERLREERTRGLALAQAFLVVQGVPRRVAHEIIKMAGIP